MSKKMMVGVILGSFLMGTVGGVGGSFLMIQNDEKENDPTQTEVNYVEESSMIDAQEKVSPAVVSIVEFMDIATLKQQQQQQMNPFFSGDTSGTDEMNLTEVAGGTGFIIDPSGIVVSNKHVVSDDQGVYKAYLNDGTEFDVTVEALDPGNDFAIL